MNKKDQKILQNLDLNPKITTSKIGKNTRLSQQVVDYRIKKLKEITQFGTIINTSKLGYEQYRILFQLSNIEEKENNQILNYLKNHKKVYWAAIVGSKWDLFITILVKNYEEFEKFLDELFNKFPKALKDYEALYTTYHEFYKHKFLHNNLLEPIRINLGNPGKIIELDNIDQKILKEIKTNCRLSSLEISKKCKVNYKTIQNRIKNLEKNNIINGYRIFLKSEEFGYKAYLLLISFGNYGRDIEKKLFAFSKTNNKITQAIKLFGKWSLLLHLRVKDQKELQKLIIEIRNKYPIIGDYEIIPIFKDISIDTFPMSK